MSGLSKAQKYICVADYEGGEFRVGDIMTAEEWREWAMSMNDYDEFDDGLREKIATAPAEIAVGLIADIWQIEIVPYNPTSKEHEKLAKMYEKNY